jgi:hypothetical protein
MRQPDRTEAELLSGFSSPKSLAAQETRQIDESCEKPVTIHDAGQGVQGPPLNSTPTSKQDFHNLLIILRNFKSVSRCWHPFGWVASHQAALGERQAVVAGDDEVVQGADVHQ